MLDVERWAELRREHFVRGEPTKELVRRTGLARNTVWVALRSGQPPAFRVPERPSKLDPFKDEIHRLLKDDPKLSGVRVREEIEPLGFDGSKTIVDDYLREIRPIFLRLRTHQRTVYRPGEVCRWDLWETSEPVPVTADAMDPSLRRRPRTRMAEPPTHHLGPRAHSAHTAAGLGRPETSQRRARSSVHCGLGERRRDPSRPGPREGPTRRSLAAS